MKYQNREILIKKLVAFILFLFVTECTYSQHILNQKLPSFNNQKWIDWVDSVQKYSDYRFYFEKDSMQNIVVELNSDSIFWINSLEHFLKKNDFYCLINPQNQIIILKNIELEARIRDVFYEVDSVSQHAMREQINSNFQQHEIIENTVVIGNSSIKLNRKVKFAGKISNSNATKVLSGATIYIEELDTILLANQLGRFEFELERGSYKFMISDLEGHKESFKVLVYSDAAVDFLVETNQILLDEVLVLSDERQLVRNSQMGLATMSLRTVELIPAMLGEKDIFKVSLMLPGIQSVGEGGAGFNVRGSPADQNMIYLDQIPIYNTSHAFGFFSAINADAIENFAIYKSQIPSEYGGRLASVMEIESRKIGNKDFSIRGGIGLLTANILLEKEIANKLSMVMSARKSYANWILPIIDNNDVANSEMDFADYLISFNVKLKPHSILKATGYYSADKLNYAQSTLYEYENKGVSLQWKYLFKKDGSNAISLTHADYYSTEQNTADISGWFLQDYHLRHTEFKEKIEWHLSKIHRISFGVNAVLYQYDKGSINPINPDYLFESIDFGFDNTFESAFFTDYRWNISSKAEINASLRLNSYFLLGPQTILQYNNNQSFEASNLKDTLIFEKNKVIKTYFQPDVRISLKYILSDNHSLKASFSNLHQNSFMLSNTLAISPFYKWYPISFHLKPMTGNQLSGGYYALFFQNRLEFSAEVYYKTVNNLVQFKDGANLTYSMYIERDVLQGKLEAYGLEFMIKKNVGRFNGILNYTYSRSSIQVGGDNLYSTINNGFAYPADFDKPHAINLNCNYEFVKRFVVSANFVYASGRPVTLPTGVYYYYGQSFLSFTKRNEYRIPDYLRIDISAKIEGNLHSDKLLHGTWIFSVYNLTGRNNAYSVFYRIDEQLVKSYKFSVFATPIFSVSYHFNLGNYENK